jgi:putative aldouronate transport system permease protein
MVTYAPHFISTVVLVSIVLMILNPRSGMLNNIIALFGGERIDFIAKPEYFKSIYVWSGIWQSAGWGSIIYIATLSTVSPELHEAAIVDGANKLHRIWNIDIPVLLPTAIILLILNLGSMFSIGFEKAFLMQNSTNLKTSEIISTYVYKIGIQGGQYSYSTAIGLLNNIINFIILISVNKISGKISDTSLW